MKTPMTKKSLVPHVKSKKKGIKIIGKWKPVALDPSLFADEKLEEIICFEELTDYKLVKSCKDLMDKGLKRKHDTVEDGGNDIFGKKKKKKKRKNTFVSEKARDKPMSDDELEDLEENINLDDETEEIVTAEPKSEEENQKETKGAKKKKKRKAKKKTDTTAQQEPTPKPTKPSKKVKNWAVSASAESSGKNADVSAWKNLCVPQLVLQALSYLGFSAPTPIQALALPSAIRDKLDVLGAAETGSGKTLAFAIPMIHSIMEWKKVQESGGEEEPESGGEEEPESGGEEEPESGGEEEPESGGEEEPESGGEEEPESGGEEEPESGVKMEDGESASGDDQEEALGEDQEVESKEEEIINEEDDIEGDDEDLGCVKVVEDVDFNFNIDPSSKSPKWDKKRPLLGLVVAPTRELAVQVKHHIDAVAMFTGIKTAIVVGGMAPQKQERVLNRRPEIVIATPGRLWELIRERHSHLSNLKQLRCLVIDEADRMVEKGHYAELSQLLELLSDVQYNPKRQTFVFSATLTLIHQAPSRLLQKKKFKKIDKDSKLESLMVKIGMKGKPKVIDLTRKEATVETLTETRIHCTNDEKDLYLYYFLLQYRGRTMVFANSIDCIKRLSSLLTILDCNPLPLHANMHQKQRLKNLERFAERESSILLTTDVAARGLDIPNVQHVLHYQVPRTSETYVHRSGRTARASSDGLSLLLIGPDDVMNFKKICRTLGKNDELPLFPVESKCMSGIKERVNLARQIEKMEYFNGKAKQQNSWLQQAADALELDLDDNLIVGKNSEQEEREKQKMLKIMKKQLKRLLSQPIFSNIMRTKYPTQSGKLSMPYLPASTSETALNTMARQKKKPKKKQL